MLTDVWTDGHTDRQTLLLRCGDASKKKKLMKKMGKKAEEQNIDIDKVEKWEKCAKLKC